MFVDQLVACNGVMANVWHIEMFLYLIYSGIDEIRAGTSNYCSAFVYFDIALIDVSIMTEI